LELTSDILILSGHGNSARTILRNPVLAKDALTSSIFMTILYHVFGNYILDCLASGRQHVLVCDHRLGVRASPKPLTVEKAERSSR
jgi:hypothetical protein